MENGPFIQVILPLKLEWEPFYVCREAVSVGDRVTVPFAGRSYAGVVSAVGVEPTVGNVKEVQSVDNGLDRILPEEIAFWRQLAAYYLCTAGEIYRAAHSPGETADEEKAARWTAELRRRLEAKTAELEKTRPGTKKEAALREGIDRLRRQLSAPELPSDPIGELATQPVPEAVRAAFKEGKTVLLEDGEDARRIGIILSLAREVRSRGKNVLWLVSGSGALSRIRTALEAAGAVFFESGQTPATRRKAISAVRAGGYLLVGTRGAILLPHHDLGLVIVDDEQNRSYKRESPSPRYHARDAALILSRLQGAGAILGSATPSLDSIYNAETGRFVRVTLPSREPGALTVIDTSSEKRKRGMKGNFSLKMLDAVSRTLGKGRKVLLLVARRAFDPDLATLEEIRSLFPDRRDDILGGDLGTVIDPEGDRLGLICLIFAEALLSGDDFRADERALQVFRQLRWKAPLAIQSKNTEHPVFQALEKGEDATAALLAEREAFGYPPYSRMIGILIRDNAPKRLEYLSSRLAAELSAAVGVRFLTGPYAPARDEDGTLRIIRIMLPRDRELPARKQRIRETVSQFGKTAKYEQHLSVDVDPVA
jgi:primosomal protein N'